MITIFHGRGNLGLWKLIFLIVVVAMCSPVAEAREGAIRDEKLRAALCEPSNVKTVKDNLSHYFVTEDNYQEYWRFTNFESPN